MAIKATYNDGSGEVGSATLKITRIWGSKSENWNAWVQVLKTPTDETPISTFSVNAPYVEGENPYVALYSSIAKLDFIKDVEHDVPQKEVVKSETKISDKQFVEAPVEAPKAKAKKQKKNG